jgi:hypothetical protein
MGLTARQRRCWRRGHRPRQYSDNRYTATKCETNHLSKSLRPDYPCANKYSALTCPSIPPRDVICSCDLGRTGHSVQ